MRMRGRSSDASRRNKKTTLRVVFLYPRLQGDFDLLGKLLEAGFDLLGDVTAYTAVQGLELLVVLIFQQLFAVLADLGPDGLHTPLRDVGRIAPAQPRQQMPLLLGGASGLFLSAGEQPADTGVFQRVGKAPVRHVDMGEGIAEDEATDRQGGHC